MSVQDLPRSSKILTDVDIIEALRDGSLIITPMIDAEEQIGANVVDLRLGSEFIVIDVSGQPYIDPVELNGLPASSIERMFRRKKIVDPRQPFVLHPGEFALGSTLEYLELPNYIGGILEGRSSLARSGLNVHSTASFIHPGACGIITFELNNVGSVPLLLRVGTRIAQILFYQMEEPSAKPYSVPETAKYSRYLATNYGRPWEDYEYGMIRERLLADRAVTRAAGM